MANNNSTTDALTERQVDVIDLLAQGKTNTEVARDLGLPLDAVKTDVVSIIGKLGTTSRESAVKVWRGKQRRKRLLKRTAMGAGAAVVLTVISLLALSFFENSASDGLASTVDPAFADVHLRIVTILDPEPGFRVLELPSEKESVFAQTGVVASLVWSPTYEHVVVRFAEPNGFHAIIDYNTGTTRLFSLDDGGVLPGNPSWSPDGRFVFFAPGYKFSGGRDAVEAGSAYIYSSDGDRVASAAPEQLIDEAGSDLFQPFRCSSGLGGWSTNSDFVHFAIIRSHSRKMTLDGEVTVLDTVEACVDLSKSLPGRQPATAYASSRADLAAIEARAPVGHRATTAHQIWAPGYAATFLPPDAPDSPLTLVSVGGVPFEFHGTMEDSRIIVFGVDLQIQDVPDIDVTGCPFLTDDSCRIAVRDALLLLDGDIEAALKGAQPRLAECNEPSALDESLCRESQTGLPQPAFSLRDEDGVTEYVSRLKFRLILGILVSRFGSADAAETDRFGDGTPRIIGVTCGPPLNPGAPLCGHAAINISWIENSPSGPQRVVVGLSFSPSPPGTSIGLTGLVFRGPGGEYDLALNGGMIDTGNWRSRRQAFLWTPPVAD